MNHEPADSPTKVEVIFHAYTHSETAELELPADFWQLDQTDREALLAAEYNLWLDGARRPWEVLTEGPVAGPAEAAAPTTPAAGPAGFSEAMQLLIASQAVRVEDIAQVMKVAPGKAKRLFREMQETYGPEPLLLHLAVFSGAADFLAMVSELKRDRAPAAT